MIIVTKEKEPAKNRFSITVGYCYRHVKQKSIIMVVGKSLDFIKRSTHLITFVKLNHNTIYTVSEDKFYNSFEPLELKKK